MQAANGKNTPKQPRPLLELWERPWWRDPAKQRCAAGIGAAEIGRRLNDVVKLEWRSQSTKLRTSE